jgi:beta-galactosidase/beta-glucuronidase
MNKMKRGMFKKLSILAIALVLVSCKNEPFVSQRETILLNGSWHFALDTANAGISEKWYTRILMDSVKLPGTLDENNKGILNTNRQETMRLSKERTYAGMAWYQKEITVAESWKGKSIRLMMERTKPTQVWVDTVPAGKSDDILTAQYYDLSSQLTPGKHLITILVNNGNGSVPRGITGSHAWTDHTQSNWNGIIGKFCLEASSQVHFENIQIYPNVESKNILVKIKIMNPGESTNKMNLVLNASAWNTETKHDVSSKSYSVSLKTGENNLELTYKMGSRFQKWSEFNPALYKLNVVLKSKEAIDNISSDFGMRKFSTLGTQFTINGTKIFLRGKHDACVDRKSVV